MVEASSVPGYRALIIEDHDFQRHVGAQVLKRCGAVSVHQARSGADAIAALENAPVPFEIMLCDLNMPGMDGLEFLRRVAERPRAGAIILASSLEPSILRSAELMARSYGLRIVGAIEKPVTQANLLPLVLRYFGQNLVAPRIRSEPMPAAEVRSALARHQFMPFFQPKVAAASRKLVGAEVLMRWSHPELGVLPPAVFVPVLEAEGLISQATLEILSDAIRHVQEWRASGLAVPLAINVSVESLNHTDLPDRFATVMAQEQLLPGNLTVEVTETTAMTDLGHSLETLTRFRMRGFGLSIDDYGTGFSSLQQLTRVPFTELKIDRVFVHGCGQQQLLKDLLESSLGLAARLKLRSVAEGVETGEDLQTIARLGCDVAQGFLIAPPMRGEELPAWHRHRSGMSVGRADISGSGDRVITPGHDDTASRPRQWQTASLP